MWVEEGITHIWWYYFRFKFEGTAVKHSYAIEKELQSSRPINIKV
jgi:hypothetical protein